MAAKFRVGLALCATALLWGTAPARAQDTQDAAQANQGGTTTVGPSELENFNLPGTVTRPAEPQPTPAPAPRQTPPQTAPTPATRQPNSPPASTRQPPAARPANAEPAAERGETAASRATQPSVSMQLPPLSDSPVTAPLANPVPTLPPAAPPSELPWPWLLAALALLGGAGAYWWFGRMRAATAGGPTADAYAAPPPEPAPAPRAPAPAAAPSPPALPPLSPPTAADDNPIGIVSTRLRPWLEVDLKPLRCVVEKDHVAIDVELTLFNSGSLPARSILLEAAMLNAGPSQDHDIEYFFSNPLGSGKRASSLPPLKKAVVRSRVITPLKDAVEYEVEGRKVYVPLVAVNAIYSWPSGEGQTASAYLVGRNTHGDKLAPFRLDRGEGAYEPVDRRQLPNGTRV